MSDPPYDYPGRTSRADAFAIFAATLAVVALAFSIPALLVASNAREKAQVAEDRAANASAAPPPASSTTPSTTTQATRPPATSSSCPAAGLGSTLSDHGATPAVGTTIRVQAGDFYFAPTCVTQTPSATVTLVVHNRGGALHNVSVPAQSIDRDVPAGKTITVRVQVSGTPVQYFCKYHKTAGMLGALLPPA
jgi:plastocyanin